MRVRVLVRTTTAAFAVFVGLWAATPADADTMILRNGDRLTGELQLGELPVVAVDGTTPVAARDTWRVTLGTVTGDVVELRRGGSVGGLVNEVAYTIRLRSGQSIVVRRHAIDQLIFHPR